MLDNYITETYNSLLGEQKMSVLITHNNEHIETIFQLLGNKENDITRAIAWIMKKCPSFLKSFIKNVSGQHVDSEKITILYQQFEKTKSENGYTDLELTDNNNVHIIIEAKRGWILPSSTQLIKYANRPSFINSNALKKHIVTLSECSQNYADSYLPFSITANGIPVSHISWKELRNLALQSKKTSNNEQKNILTEFTQYLGGLMTTQNKNSNLVYVVSINNRKIEGTNFSNSDIVEKGYYYCPFGTNGWPKEAPNYIAFRYNGKLQAIHHIEGYTISKNIHDVINFMPDENWKADHFIFNLGPKIIPPKVIKTGNIYRNGRVWAAIDLLLTCNTIAEARDKTKER